MLHSPSTLPLLHPNHANDNISVMSEATYALRGVEEGGGDGESDWDKQLKDIEENEAWEKSTNQIPAELQPLYVPFLKTLPLRLKVLCMRLCGATGWQIITCRNLYNILRKAPTESLAFFIDLLMSLAASGTLVTSLAFFAGLRSREYTEAASEVPREKMDFLLDVVKHLHSEDYLQMLFNLIHDTSINTVIEYIEETREPMAKHCRFCRVRRQYELETRLQTGNQIPEGLLPVVGNLPMYHKPQVWSAADEKQFRVDVDNGKIWFKKYDIDLMRICDKCLADTFDAMSMDGRFSPLFNLEPSDRKKALADLRGKEKRIGEMIKKLFFERLKRRIRDFALVALERQRHGRHEEELELTRRAEHEKWLADKREKKERYDRMVDKAMAFDPKIQAEERRFMQKELAKLKDYVDLKYHLGFDDKSPAPLVREDPHSWVLSNKDPSGLPITKEAAAKRFGTNSYTPSVHYEKLNAWKNETTLAYTNYVNDMNEIARKRHEADLMEHNEYLLYIDNREARLKRKQELQRRTLQLEEESRVERRAADRLARRLLRFAQYEQVERGLMETEDNRSYKLRYWCRELEIAKEEREGMFNEECEQCQVDRFWGLDKFALERDLHERAVRDYFLKRVQETRAMCEFTNVIMRQRGLNLVHEITTDNSDAYVKQRPDKHKSFDTFLTHVIASSASVSSASVSVDRPSLAEGSYESGAFNSGLGSSGIIPGNSLITNSFASSSLVSKGTLE